MPMQKYPSILIIHANANANAPTRGQC